MRTRTNVHVMVGHKGTVSDVKCQEVDPQVITGSMDVSLPSPLCFVTLC